MQHSLIDRSNVHTCKQSLNDHSIRYIYMQHFFITDAYTPVDCRQSATYTKMSATFTNVSLLTSPLQQCSIYVSPAVVSSNAAYHLSFFAPLASCLGHINCIMVCTGSLALPGHT